jgi:50S ribosomal subunit-associated GTPase HflX
VSAHTRQGLAELNQAVADRLDADLFHAHLEAEATNGKLLAWLKSHAREVSEEYRDNKVLITCQLDEEVLGQAQRLGAIRLHGDPAVLDLDHAPTPSAPPEI